MIVSIMRSASKQRYLSLMIFWLWLGLAGAGLFRGAAPVAAQSKDNCIDCHRQLKDKAAQVVAIFQTSTHSRSGVKCDGCHGGDSSQSDKTKAHAGQFIARPDAAATLEMCGACHRQPLEFFKKSRHIAAQPNAARLDCAECHGVHAIGAASESFRWPTFCAGCHGLEYLPQLTRPFQEMLALADDLREGIHRLEVKGLAPARELTERRKEIRHMISELVHQTDGKGAVERIPRVLELGAALKQQIASEEKR
ncbi:MAG TPA: cytochrome c3 family protein [Blastocatellia bacterium]|nr:cytochrome c3 family protein [Blastocatellia bacterium]